MRELKPDESEKINTKLIKYIGTENLKTLKEEGNIYMHNQKIYYCTKEMIKHSSSIGRKELVGMGTLLGKFTKSLKFHIMITSLNLLAPLALNKIWVKNSAEMNFLYGNDIQKAHVLKISENVLTNSYVFVFNQSDLCLGFGVCAKASSMLASCDGRSTVLIHQSDCGEYLRQQDIMF